MTKLCELCGHDEEWHKRSPKRHDFKPMRDKCPKCGSGTKAVTLSPCDVSAELRDPWHDSPSGRYDRDTVRKLEQQIADEGGNRFTKIKSQSEKERFEHEMSKQGTNWKQPSEGEPSPSSVAEQPQPNVKGGPCSVCGETTEWACADCKIDKRFTVWLCHRRECREKHEASNCTKPAAVLTPVAEQPTREQAVEGLIEALRRIAFPVKAMEKDAERDGMILNGLIAHQLADDPQYLRGIARDAIRNYEEASRGGAVEGLVGALRDTINDICQIGEPKLDGTIVKIQRALAQYEASRGGNNG